MLTGYVAINGEISTADKAKISVFDRSYLYGDGLMEVMYASRGTVVDAALHLKRLYLAADKLHIDLPWQQSLLLNELQRLASYYDSCYLRLTISSGLGAGVRRSAEQKPQRTIICLPYVRPKDPEPLVVSSALRHANFANAVKTPNYLESIVALASLPTEQQDILWLTADDMITETTTANIFFLKTGNDHNKDSWVFYTPTDTNALLAGITRHRVCDYLKQQGYAVQAKTIAYEELKSFNAAFITASVQGMRLLKQIDSYVFDTNILRHLCMSFNQLLATATQD